MDDEAVQIRAPCMPDSRLCLCITLHFNRAAAEDDLLVHTHKTHRHTTLVQGLPEGWLTMTMMSCERWGSVWRPTTSDVQNIVS